MHTSLRLKQTILLFRQCRTRMGNGFLVVFFLNLLCFGVSHFTATLFPSRILGRLADDGNLTYIAVLLAVLAGMAVASNYFDQLQTQQLFSFRLREIATIQKASLDVPVSEMETEDGRRRIEDALSAVASGNDYGLEAYLAAAVRELQIILTFVLYVLLLPQLPLWIYGLVALGLMTMLPWELHSQQQEVKLTNLNMSDRHVLEEFRRCILQTDYALDARMFDGSGYTQAELVNRTQPLDAFARRRRSLRLRKAGGTGLLILVKNILFVAIAAMQLSGLTIDNAILYLSVLTNVDALAMQLIQALCQMKNNRPSVQLYLDFLSANPDPAATGSSAGLTYAARPAQSFELETLSFDHVSFQYPGHAVFQDISFTLHRGEKIAVVGPNGVGKSTMVKLLLGTLTPDSGNVQVNGTDVQALDQAQYWQHISAALQNAPFLAFTLAENITCQPPKQQDRKRLERAAADAGLASLISRLPHGLDTYCTSAYHADGVDLSGGEKQKVLMARMLYKDADLLLLDEPTASLDAKAEQEVYQLYARLARSKLCLFVSHRLNTTAFCDRILFIEDASHIYLETFEELFASNEMFRHMYLLQEKQYQEGELHA